MKVQEAPGESHCTRTAVPEPAAKLPPSTLAEKSSKGNTADVRISPTREEMASRPFPWSKMMVLCMIHAQQLVCSVLGGAEWKAWWLNSVSQLRGHASRTLAAICPHLTFPWHMPEQSCDQTEQGRRKMGSLSQSAWVFRKAGLQSMFSAHFCH